MVTIRQNADRGTYLRYITFWVQAATASLLLAGLFPPAMEGVPVPERPGAGSRVQDEFDSPALQRNLEDPEALAALAGERFRQGRLAEAEALAARLVELDPDSTHGWELLAVILYLRDDLRGALHAWSRGRPPVVRDVEVRIVGYSGSRATADGADPVRISGLVAGRPLTLEALVRGERRLSALPAASQARLGYRALSSTEATVDGAVVLRASNPFTGAALVAHVLRLLGRRVHLVSADPLGRMEQWELGGTVEGSLRRGTVSLAHPAPGGAGIWHWKVGHRVGRYGSVGHDAAVREERTGVRWTHTDWATASLRWRAHSEVELRPGRGTFAGVGAGWTFLPWNERSSITADGTGWFRIGERFSGDRIQGAATRSGRIELRAALHPLLPSTVEAPSGIAGRIGVAAVSSGIPPDLVPRIGAGGNADLLMRAGSDLDHRGVIRPIFPGSAWIHGGVEILRPLGSVGPVGIGVAAFADGVRVVTSAPGSTDSVARTGAVHLGAGVRARVPGVAGWLRVDWGIDPADGASRLSAAWVQGGGPG